MLLVGFIYRSLRRKRGINLRNQRQAFYTLSRRFQSFPYVACALPDIVKVTVPACQH
jgi:hypothetical protein